MSNILLVEDNATQAMQMKLLLESASHTVTCVDDGTVALERLADGFIDLVVTDLELPLLSGLELIKKMQADFPQIPAVLVTGPGSERLAAEALKHGAAAYVPMLLLYEMLLVTVENVLGVLRTDRSYAELIDHLTENRLVFDLPCNPDFIEPVIDLTMHLAAGMELLCGTDLHRVSIALGHVLSNSFFRGNLELTHTQWRAQCNNEETQELVQQRLHQLPFKNRKVHFDARLMRDTLRVTVRDEGHGFDVRKQAHLNLAQAMDADRGRGWVLIHSFMDKVTYNERGNEVTLVKHCSTRT